MNDVLIPAASPGATDFPLIADEARARNRSRLRTALGVVGIAIVAVFLWRASRTIDWHATWKTLQTVNPVWYIAALAIFWITFMVRTVRWRVLLGNASIIRPHDGTDGQPVRFGTVTMAMLRAWFLNAVTVGQLGDAYRALTISRRAHARTTRVIGTILAERVSEVVILTAMLVPALVHVFGKRLPFSPVELWATIGAILVAGPLALAIGPRILVAASNRLPEKIAPHVHELALGIQECLRPPFRVIACSVMVWTGETFTLAVAAHALGLHVSIPQAAAIALTTALLTAVPITPAGIGIAESGMVLMFRGIGLSLEDATALTILARSITFGSLVIVGGMGWLPALVLKRSAPVEPATI